MFLVICMFITSMNIIAEKSEGAYVSQINENVKETNRIVISTGPLNFDDYEMPAETPSPQVHEKMKRFYQYISKHRPDRPMIAPRWVL